MVKISALLLVCLITAGCALDESSDADVRTFLRTYNEIDRNLSRVAAEAAWAAATDLTPENTNRRIGAESALAAFRGSPFVIETSQRFLESRASLTDLEFRQLDKILLLAAEYPGTVPDLAARRVAAEAMADASLQGFPYCEERRGNTCAAALTPDEIEAVLFQSRDLPRRRRVWEAAKQVGVVVKPRLAEIRNLQNRAARELGYSSYLHLQVSDYGMDVADLMKLMEETAARMRPLYEQVFQYAAGRLSERYRQSRPRELPAHWLPHPLGQAWPGVVETIHDEALFQGKSAEWVVRQAAQFYESLGFDRLPESFWVKSDLYRTPATSARLKSNGARSWHIDRGRDVRSSMSAAPDMRWFLTSHRELGRVHYFLACSREELPPVLREGLNRAFHVAIGNLGAMAARRESYLRQIGLPTAGRAAAPMDVLLAEALEGPIVFLPWAAGVVSHFEYELYEKELPPGRFNTRWWELVRRYQNIVPPSPRGEQFCDACTTAHIVEEPARYYDLVLAQLIQYQLHDYISRKILRQDPREASYYDRPDVGDWLLDIMELGATRDWREVLKEKTGEDLSVRALLEYFQPLAEHLKELEGARDQ